MPVHCLKTENIIKTPQVFWLSCVIKLSRGVDTALDSRMSHNNGFRVVAWGNPFLYALMPFVYKRITQIASLTLRKNDVPVSFSLKGQKIVGGLLAYKVQTGVAVKKFQLPSNLKMWDFVFFKIRLGDAMETSWECKGETWGTPWRCFELETQSFLLA